MHSYIIAAVAFLSYMCGAPTNSEASPLNKAKPEDSDCSVETSPPVDRIDWNIIWAANIEFLSNAEKHFANEFREEMDRLRNSSSDHKDSEMDPAQANAILQNATAYEENTNYP
ncbi:uncharacterized protein LOC122622291 [Drosophila teissieri]|uniref:uncharacterized protein LOC122622291 n=1 Tax=Drosophila teissieri TaxID=7243 RepID=UPI001CB9F57B|nr:uncharacterized protein LOC122622291 [Drosophila teissieri]